MGFAKELQNSVAMTTGQWKQYGDQRSAENNQETIDQAGTNVQDTLKAYNTYATINVDKTILNVTDTGNAQLKIGMMQDVGRVNVKIS